MFFAADLDPVPGDWIKYFLIVVFAFVAFAEKVKSLFSKPKEPAKEPVAAPTPQPLIVRKESDPVTRHEFDELAGRVNQITKELPEMERRLNNAGEKRAEAIHQRFNPVAENVEASKREVSVLTDIVKAVLRRRDRSKAPAHD
jgi:hypothetical protein